MIKKFRNILNIDDKMDEINEAITKLSEQMALMSTVKKPTRYQEIYLNQEKDIIDYEQVKDMFEDKYRKDALSKYSGIKENLQECIIQYDKILYFNKDSINYVELTSKLYELYVLRSFILEILFKSSEIESFYFYAINNNALYNIVSSIPHIDMDKIFLLDHEKDLDHTYYTIINIRHDKIIIVAPKEDYEIESRYKKTVIRVLYSIYFEKYFLYHLSSGSKE